MAVGHLAADAGRAHRLGLAARARVREIFSPARLAEQTGALYLRLARGAIGPRS